MRQKCDCEQEGFFRSGVPGILAHMRDGRLASGAKVERCDACQRYATDQAAYDQLVALGLVVDWPVKKYKVELTCKAYQEATVTVEAADEDEARQKAMEKIDDLEWSTFDTDGAEVTGVEEVVEEAQPVEVTKSERSYQFEVSAVVCFTVKARNRGAAQRLASDLVNNVTDGMRELTWPGAYDPVVCLDESGPELVEETGG
jgi:hypothetical protein